MPANNGRRPSLDVCDIKLRNGMVIREINPQNWRWKEWPEGPHDYDIVQYQPAGLLKRWEGKKSP